MLNYTKIRELLHEAASIYSLEADEWELLHGDLADKNPETKIPSGEFLHGEELSVAEFKYLELSEKVRNTFNRLGPELLSYGYAAYNCTISGVAAHGIDHYDMDTEVKAKFGHRVSVDSESGQFFCYCASVDAEEILEFVKEIGGANAGGTWITYGGHEGNAAFDVSENDEWMIAGIENWTEAKKMLEKLKV